MNNELIFFGDFYYDFDYSAKDLEEIASWIKDNEYQTILNLEGGFWGQASCEIQKRGAHLSSSMQALEMLEKLSTAGVCLANNHMMDYGKEGLEKTIHLLDESEILHSGAGMNLFEAGKPFVVTAGNTKITILNYGWDQEETVPAKKDTAGCSPRDKKLILSQIKAFNNKREDNEKLVVCIHWGYEYNRLPQPYDIDLGHAMIDAGADLVIGHHPHVMQPKEIYKGKRIYYSMGDFYFSSRRVRHNRQFSEKIPGQCDYGLGVIWNPEADSFEEVLLHYDRKEDRSLILTAPGLEKSDTKALEFCLEDISGTDYLSSAYYRKTVSRRRNINPVLGTDSRKNRKKLNQLAFKRKFRKFIKKILHK